MQVNVYVRYYALDKDGAQTGNVVYEGQHTGDSEIVRRSLLALASEASLQNAECEYTIRGPSAAMPVPLENWWLPSS